MSIWRYLFPKRRPQQRLPLLTLHYSSEQSPYPDPGRAADHKTFMLKGRGIVRTRQDAIRCLLRHPGQSLAQIERSERRQRKFQNRLARAWRRFWRRW